MMNHMAEPQEVKQRENTPLPYQQRVYQTKRSPIHHTQLIQFAWPIPGEPRVLHNTSFVLVTRMRGGGGRWTVKTEGRPTSESHQVGTKEGALEFAMSLAREENCSLVVVREACDESESTTP